MEGLGERDYNNGVVYRGQFHQAQEHGCGVKVIYDEEAEGGMIIQVGRKRVVIIIITIVITVSLSCAYGRLLCSGWRVFARRLPWPDRLLRCHGGRGDCRRGNDGSRARKVVHDEARRR